jgi:hypothetical protein
MSRTSRTAHTACERAAVPVRGSRPHALGGWRSEDIGSLEVDIRKWHESIPRPILQEILAQRVQRSRKRFNGGRGPSACSMRRLTAASDAAEAVRGNYREMPPKMRGTWDRSGA